MKEIKINKDKCRVDKRRLVLDCDIDNINYRFHYDGWPESRVEYFSIDNIEQLPGRGWGILTDYKHCVQAFFDVAKGDEKVFIDRRYEHNYEFDVYFSGKAYLVDLSTPLSSSEGLKKE